MTPENGVVFLMASELPVSLQNKILKGKYS